MRKRLALLLLMKLSGLLLLKADAQSRLSLEHYYTMEISSPVSVMPVASFQTSNNFYAEGRYNYEALNTFSFYMGRTFSKEAALSYSISPIAGAVMGDYNGGSIGATVSLGYKNFYLYTQPQYTFSLAGAYDNFTYSWTDFTYSPLDWLSVGVSLQHTKPYRSPGFVQGGLVLEAAYKKITFPIYMFNPHTSDRTIIVGANFEVNFKKSKAKQRRESDSFKEVYPVKIIANLPESASQSTSKEEVKPLEAEVKVRRVNVVVRTKSENTDSDQRIMNKSKQEAEKLATGRAESLKLPFHQPERSAPVKKASHNTPGKVAVIAKEQENLVSAAKAVADNFRKSTNQLSASGSQFALLLGPFKTEDEAMMIKSRLFELFEKEAILYSDGKEIKLRIPGFEDEKAAESFNLIASNQGCKAAATIVKYKLKSIDAIPLKSNPKPFEATKL